MIKILKYLIFSQVQQPGQQEQQPQPQPGAPQAPAAQPQQPAPQAGQPAAPQQPQQPAAQPQPAPPGEAVSMAAMLQWAGAGGAASGAIQAVLNLLANVLGAGAFSFMGFLMTVLIAVVMGVLVAILLGQFGKKIPIQGSLTVKAGLFMFLLNIIAGFVLGLGEGFLGLLLGIIGIGAGAFIYGYLIKQKLPNLI